MKNLLSVVLMLLSLQCWSAITIISDLDDTIKITEAGGNPTDIIGDDVYTGMPEFLKAAKDYAPTLYVLSASPEFMRSKIVYTLKRRGVSYQGLVLRERLSEGKLDYKVREIKKIMESTPDDFIFIGDDLGKDPEVYEEIKKLYPARVLAVYIHVVKNRYFTGDATSYWTSFDLLLREFEAGRMTPGWIEFVYEKLLTEINREMIFPKKADCPTEASIWEWQTRTVFMQEALELINHFNRYCQSRKAII